mgnify:CR=1 FL=1
MIYEAGVIGAEPARLPLSIGDPTLVSGALSVVSMYEIFTNYLQRGNVDVGFLGGAQIDKYGNINMIGIGEHPKLKVRGPGSIGSIWLGSGATANYTEHHSKRVFVEKVAHRSGAGWCEGGDSRHKLLDGRDGPPYCWTPICVCDFTEDEHRMRLVSVHPGYSVEDVVANTGFELVIEGTVPQTTPPTDWELQVLRTQVDRGGRLKNRRLTVGL